MDTYVGLDAEHNPSIIVSNDCLCIVYLTLCRLHFTYLYEATARGPESCAAPPTPTPRHDPAGAGRPGRCHATDDPLRRGGPVQSFRWPSVTARRNVRRRRGGVVRNRRRGTPWPSTLREDDYLHCPRCPSSPGKMQLPLRSREIRLPRRRVACGPSVWGTKYGLDSVTSTGRGNAGTRCQCSKRAPCSSPGSVSTPPSS